MDESYKKWLGVDTAGRCLMSEQNQRTVPTFKILPCNPSAPAADQHARQHLTTMMAPPSKEDLRLHTQQRTSGIDLEPPQDIVASALGAFVVS